MAATDFERIWNAWHCDIVTTAELTAHVLDSITDLDAPEWLKSAAIICKGLLEQQTIGAPVPPWDRIRPAVTSDKT